MHSGPDKLKKSIRFTINLSNRSFELRPVFLLLILLALLITAVMTGARFFPQEKQQDHLLGQLSKLQHKQQRLHEKLAENEALLALRDGQIEGLKQEMEQLRGEKTAMKSRLEMFDEVLASKKVKGVHFLRPEFSWEDQHSISYQLILVKGENYPRWIQGHLEFSVIDANGQTVLLSNQKGKNRHKIEMTSHAFVEGTLVWPQNWRPETLHVTLINHLGKQKGHIEIPVLASRLSRDSTVKEQRP